jgi:Tol biopolymer transport system component
MRTPFPHNVLTTALASALLLGLSACGGGSEDTSTIAGNTSADALDSKSTTQAKPRRAPPPPTPAPSPVIVPVDSSLALVDSNAAGQDALGLTAVCGISADGSQVIFTTDANLIDGIPLFNIRKNVFLKNVRTGSLTRINTNSTGGLLSDATCVGMTPDASAVVFTTPQIFPEVFSGNPIVGSPGVEPAVYVKNLRTGAVTNVAPPLNTFSNISGYRFQSISDDASRVALTAEPATQYLGGYQTIALGPAIALVRDIPTGALINLSQAISIDLSGDARVDSKTLLSPDGTKIAFDSRANYPALGDTNGGTDAFVLDIASRSVRLVSPAGSSGFRVLSFLSGGSRLALQNEAGVHIKDLATNASRLVFAATFGIAQPVPSSFSGDGSLLTYTRPNYSNASNRDEAVVRNIATGREQLVSTTATGVAGNGDSNFPLISRDGSRVVFRSFSSNLVRPALTPTYRTFVKTLSTPATTPGL